MRLACGGRSCLKGAPTRRMSREEESQGSSDPAYARRPSEARMVDGTVVQRTCRLAREDLGKLVVRWRKCEGRSGTAHGGGRGGPRCMAMWRFGFGPMPFPSEVMRASRSARMSLQGAPGWSAVGCHRWRTAWASQSDGVATGAGCRSFWFWARAFSSVGPAGAALRS